jgi:transcriptional regulator with XRE-family HTH domain
MTNSKKQTNALNILHNRIIAGDPGREAELERERSNAKIARLICDYREEAGLTQKQLAELIGTTQSVISRLEDSDYDGHSISMLNRIAAALNKQLSVDMSNEEASTSELHYSFQKLMYLCRLKKRWTVEKAAKELGLEPGDIYALERSENYKPTPFVLYRLSQAYDVPQEKLAVLVGAFKKVPNELMKEASRFVAQSDSFDKITNEEKKLVDGFIKILKQKF